MKTTQLRVRPTAFAVALMMYASITTAQTTTQAADPMKAAIEKAIATNPEIAARFNALRASKDGVDVARSAWLPRVDLSANVGRDSNRITTQNPETQSINRSGAALTLSQLLWDGLGTSRDVERLGHERMGKYFDLIDITEQTALEAGRAYQDVQRYRRLVKLAEDNYVQHRYASQQINSRFKAGVGRGVDLEQANARLALAESNLVTETSNLHDVTARYLRIVGEAPPARMPNLTLLNGGLPTTAEQAIGASLKNNAAISASIENLRAARSATQLRESVYQPRVEARVRAGAGNNFDGVLDQRRSTTAEVVLSWNLYNGGADQARVRQQTNLLNQAADIRDKTCRDTRQTASIAFNDTRKLVETIRLLDANVLSIEKARDAYRQQFDIGQRSLLDLLNAENEVYTARRSYANAEHDLGTAQLRTLAAMNQLTARLGIARPDARAEAGDTADWTAGDDGPGRCPVEEVQVNATAIATLDQRAQAVANSAAVPPSPTATPVPAASAPVRNAPPVVATPLPANDTGVRDVNAAVGAWVAAWSAKDTERYLGFYTKDFKTATLTHDAWLAQRKRLVGKAGPIKVELSDVKTRQIAADQVEASFTQNYVSDNFKDRVAKTQVWKRVDGKWLIVSEATN